MDDTTGNMMHFTGITLPMRRKIIENTKNLITRLTDKQVLKGSYVQMTEFEISDLCLLMPDVLTSEPMCLELTIDPSLFILGDIFGQYGHLLRIFDYFGHPPEKTYLFLGNYADNGLQNLETIALLFAYKIIYPQSIYLLRGKHECKRISRFYGLYDECIKRFNRRLWFNIINVFTYLPVCAIIDDKIFCVHSGLSPSIQYNGLANLQEFKHYLKTFLTRPVEPTFNSLLTHLIWSSPDLDSKMWNQNPVGLGYLFGSKVVSTICDQFHLKFIIRSSELIADGYNFFQDPRLITIFSAPDYIGVYGNNGAIIQLYKSPKESEIRVKIKILKPIIRLRCKPTLRMNMIIDEIAYDFSPNKTRTAGIVR